MSNSYAYNQNTMKHLAKTIENIYNHDTYRITRELGFPTVEATEKFLEDPQSGRLYEIAVAANAAGLLMTFTISDDISIQPIYSLMDKYVTNASARDSQLLEQLGMQDDKMRLVMQQLDNQHELFVSLIEYRKNNIPIDTFAKLTGWDEEFIDYYENNIRLSDVNKLYTYAEALGTVIIVDTVQYAQPSA